jgi:hypothetical protein
MTGAALRDECAHVLDSAADSLAGPVSEPSHGPDDVMCARRLFGRYMPTGIHGGNQQGDERVIGCEGAHAE